MTLRTRIGGYLFEMRAATDAEIASHRETSIQQGWHLPSTYGHATVGAFVSPTGNVMDLPYELRTTRMIVQPAMLLDIAAEDVANLNDRVRESAQLCECWRDSFTCPNCAIDSALVSRLYSTARGNVWKLKAHAGNGRNLFDARDEKSFGQRL